MASAVFFLISWALSTGLQPRISSFVLIAYLGIGGVSLISSALRPHTIFSLSSPHPPRRHTTRMHANHISAIHNPPNRSHHVQLPPSIQLHLATNPSRSIMGSRRRRNNRSLPLSILFLKQYMWNQEFPQYVGIRIRTAGPSFTSHEAI